MPTTRSSIVGLAVLGVVALGACSSSTKPTAATPAPVPAAAAAAANVSGSLDAADQSSDGKTITVKTVNIKGASGFIAIHADLSGKPGPVVGHAAIPEGDSSSVVIKLDSPVATGA